MTAYKLKSIANQEFTVTINGYVCDFHLHTFRDLLYCSLSVDGQELVKSVRCVPNGWLIPMTRIAADLGNFRFETDGDSYPFYTLFDRGSCLLVHYTADEMESL